MSEIVNGSCHCGKVTLEAPAQAMFTFSCHCSGCRKLSSGGRLLGHGTSVDAVTINGNVKTYTYSGDSGEDIVLTFCPFCSTQLYAEPKAHPGMAAIRASVLDNAADFTPMQFLHTDGAFSWDKTSLNP